MSSWYLVLGLLGGDGTSCVTQGVLFCCHTFVSCEKIRNACRALFQPGSKMPSNDDSWHSVCLDSVAVNTVGFPFLGYFHSACIIQFIENIHIYRSFLLYFHHPLLKLADRISGKLNLCRLGIPKRVSISADHGPAEDFVAVNPTWVVFSFADNAREKKPREACLTGVK